jgi:Zn-dependent protease with chaperone function
MKEKVASLVHTIETLRVRYCLPPIVLYLTEGDEAQASWGRGLSITLGDDLIRDYPLNTLEGIVAHEVGHLRPDNQSLSDEEAEFDADAFACGLGYGPGLAKFLVDKLCENFESEFHPPPVSSRIERMYDQHRLADYAGTHVE